MDYESVQTLIPGDKNHKEGDSIANWGSPVNSNVNQYIANFDDTYMQTIVKDDWVDDLLNQLDSPFPSPVPTSQPNNQFPNSIETPKGYSVLKLNHQGTWGVDHNPMVSHGVIPMTSSRMNNSDSSKIVGYTGYNSASMNTFNPQYFGGSSIKNVASTNTFNNVTSAKKAFDSRGRTVTPDDLLFSFAHSSAQNFHQQKLCNPNSYNMGFPISANGVQSNFQNSLEATQFLGTIYNTHTSNRGTFFQPQVHMPRPGIPGPWVRQLTVRDQSNGFKIPRLNSWESRRGRPPIAEGRSSHNCNDLNCNICGPATFGMTSRKRLYHFEAPGNGSWSGTSTLLESGKRKYPFEPGNNDSSVSRGTDLMESKKQKCYLAPSYYESLVDRGTLMDELTKSYLPFDLPPLEQWPNSSEDASSPNETDGKEESSPLGPNVSSGTLMDVYNSFIKSSASTKDAMPNSEEDALGLKVNNVPSELSCEEKVICGFNSALDDYESAFESMRSMKSIILESEKTSTRITSSDDHGPEVEVMNIKTCGASVAAYFDDNVSGLGSRNFKKQSASLADSFTKYQIKEHLSSLIKHKKDISGDTTPLVSQNPCQLCCKHKLLLAPTPLYCSSCDLRIKQKVKYYRSTAENSSIEHSICTGCFKGSRGPTIITRGVSVSKANLLMAKNDEEIEDSWVLCDKCQLWQHRICGLYNNETDLEGKAEYVCPKCCLKERENGTRSSSSKAVSGAKDLPRTNLSDHIEQRLFTRLKQEREETANFHGIASEEVPVAEDLVVRVVVSVEKELEVKKQFRNIFHGQNYPEKIGYRSKLILLFQKIGGVDICLFGMYVQEFGSECNGPNNRCVYISYIDSVKYFQPERKTVSGEPLRTFVYHEILIGYLEHCKKRGFGSCYIWSCPLIKGEDYIFYCHPKTQKTPEKIKLRQWYKLMIKKAVKDGIVVDQTNLFNEFFVPSNIKISAAHLPYFDGDYWSEIAENISKRIDDEESSGGKSSINSRTKRILMANGQETPTKDALVMQELGDIILPEKENYMILLLQHVCTSCNELMLSGSRWFCNQCNKIQLCSRCVSPGRMHKCSPCKNTALSEDVLSYIPVDTKDKDDVSMNKLFETRSNFLNKCQSSLYQFDTLGHAKYSSMMILYHLEHNLVGQPKGDTFPTRKLIPSSTEVITEPRREQPQNKKTDTLSQALDALSHASQCKTRDGCYSDCQTVKKLLRHASICTTGRRNGCETCRGAWWILNKHINTCTKLNCTIPRCSDIRKQTATLAGDQISAN